MSNRFAICIVGPICSGKSTLAERISVELNIPYLTETMFDNGLMELLDHLDDYDRVIIEHCSLLNFHDRITKHFTLISVVYIQISEDLMQAHIQQRIAKGGTGDFILIDPIEMKQEIEKAISMLPEKTSLWIMRINSDKDYPVETERILLELRNFL